MLTISGVQFQGLMKLVTDARIETKIAIGVSGVNYRQIITQL